MLLKPYLLILLKNSYLDLHYHLLVPQNVIEPDRVDKNEVEFLGGLVSKKKGVAFMNLPLIITIEHWFLAMNVYPAWTKAVIHNESKV